MNPSDTAATPSGPQGANDLLGRIGCSLLTFHASGFEEALDRIATRGFRAVDLAAMPGFCDHFDPLTLSDEEISLLGASLSKRGLRVSSINLYPGNLADPDAAGPTRFVERCLRLASMIRAPLITIPPGPLVKAEDWDATAKVVAERIRGFLDLASSAGVRLSVEAPHVRTLAEDCHQARKLFDLVGDPRIGATFDTSHVQRTADRPLVDLYRRLGAEVIHVHLRDSLDGEITVTPGKGDCDYASIIRALAGDGYRGDFNFELEYETSDPGFVGRELDFAQEHLRILLKGSPIPLSHAIHKQGWYRSIQRARRALSHPKEFIIGHPRLHGMLKPPVRAFRKVRREALPYRQVRFESGWRWHWKIGRSGKRIAYAPASIHSEGGVDRPPKRVAIIGCGYTGKFMHGPGFARIPGMKVVGVCDVDRARADGVSRELGCPAFYNASEMVRQVHPDLVANCTREWLHHEISLMAMEAGADVFCEKIMAEDYCKGEEMVRVAREKGRVLGVNFNWRFLPGILKIREIRDSGVLGKLHMLRLLCHSWVHHHGIDLARHLGGPLKSVSAVIQEDPAVRSFSEWNPYVGGMLYMPSLACIANLETADGVAVSFASSDLLEPGALMLNLDAVFREGTVTLSGVLDGDAVGSLSSSSKKVLDLRCRPTDGPANFSISFQRSIQSFAEAYLGGKRCPVNGEDALEVMAVERALLEAARTGSKIFL